MNSSASKKPELHLRDILVPFGFYLFAILFLESVCSFISGGRLPSPYSILFIIAEALFLAFLSGFFSRGHIIIGVWLGLLTAFYLIQVVYYCQFGSFPPLSIAGMGVTAATGFREELADTLRVHLPETAVCFVPLVLYILFLLLVNRSRRPGRFGLLHHACVLALCIAFWAGGVAVLPLGGTGSGTAYESFHSSRVNTDMSVSRLGAMTSSLLELGCMTGILPETDDSGNLTSGSVVNPFSSPQPAADEVLSGSGDESEAGGREPSPSPEPVIDRSPNVIAEIDFDELYELAGNTGLQSLCTYFASQTGSCKNEYTGLMEGYNLIYICGEAFDTVAIDPELTPTLYMMANSGIVLNNYYNSIKNVTTNGEFAFMTGLWPDFYRSNGCGDTMGSFYATRRNYMPYGLGNVFAGMGVESFAYHGYNGYYYGREETHPNLGYKCRFRDDGMKFSTSVPSSDYELIEQTVDDYIGLDRFNVYYMTFSGHGNYSRYNPIDDMNYDYVSEKLSDKGYSLEALCYLAGNYELERGLDYLLERLEQAGQLDRTLIVLAGDHYPYSLSSAQYKELAGDVDADFGIYKSTCIMWSASIEEPIVTDACCCNVDVLPTVLNLLGVEYDSRLLSGTDILSDSDHMAVLYNKSFITDKVKYNAVNGSAQWLIDTESQSEDQLNQYLKYVQDTINDKFAVANKIVNTNFYKFVWQNSGLKDFG